MKITNKFASLSELLDYAWARSFEFTQVAEMAQSSGIAMTEEQFNLGYQERGESMMKSYRLNLPTPNIDLEF